MRPVYPRTADQPFWIQPLVILLVSWAASSPAAGEVFIGFLPGRTVTDIELAGETVWAVADSQLFRWDEQAQDFKAVDFATGQVQHIEWVPEGLLVAYEEEETLQAAQQPRVGHRQNLAMIDVSRRDINGLPLAAFSSSSSSGLRPPFKVIKRIEQDLWVAEPDRVARLPLSGLNRPVGPVKTFAVPPNRGTVGDIVEAGGEIWVLTSHQYGAGFLFRLQGDQLVPERAAEAPASDGLAAQCLAAAFDDAWLCYGTRVRSRSSGWKRVPTLLDGGGFTHITGDEKVMWLGNRKALWRTLSKTARPAKVFPAADAPLQVVDLRMLDGQLWVLTERRGVFRHDADVSLRIQVEGLSVFGRVINFNSEVGVRRIWYVRGGKVAYPSSPSGRFKVLLARSAETLKDRLKKGDPHESLETARVSTPRQLSFKIHASAEDEHGNREELRSKRIITAPIRAAVLLYLLSCLVLVLVAPLWQGFLFPVAGRQVPAVLFPATLLTGIGWIRRVLLIRYWNNRRAATASRPCPDQAIELTRKVRERIGGERGRKLLRLRTTAPADALRAVEDELLGPRSLAWWTTSGTMVARTLWIGLRARRPLLLGAEDLAGDPKDPLAGLEKALRARLRGDGNILNDELAERMLVSGDLVLLASRGDLEGGKSKALEQFLRSLGSGTRVVIAGSDFAPNEWEEIGYEVEDVAQPPRSAAQAAGALDSAGPSSPRTRA